ncbi:MAG: S-methyl-5-thioribose-1-phosphate isomerase [Deltaproteobacteria bacterium]|nr:S-methyl-5-thioribose-1-phosphate isomerase [Deltaproteobacteria bacterium]
MLVGGRHYRSIWLDEVSGLPRIIDQTRLPFEFALRTLARVDDVAEAIASMRVRGAPLIGAAAAHGLAVALSVDPSDTGLAAAVRQLAETRPTAINLRWALERVVRVVAPIPARDRAARARAEAIAICDEDVETCAAIGEHGAALLERMSAERPGRPLQVLTHCNAGWLATVDWGTALAPLYKAHDAGIPLHVWVDETRPRNQGAALTAFELREHGVAHTVVADNAGGHLMQRGQVDLVLVGSDRTTATGDVCNKIGTYLKALAAKAHAIPFYVALPLSTVDWSIADGLREIPIEERSGDEVRTISGRTPGGRIERVELFSAQSPAANPAFDVTPAALVTGLVTERGIVAATREALASLRKER